MIRGAIRNAVGPRIVPRPRIPLLPGGLGDPAVAERSEELLEGFGEP